MDLADRVDAFELQVRALAANRDELAWRNARAEATTLLLELRNRYVSEQRAALERRVAPPVATEEQLRRVRSLIEAIDNRLKMLV